MSKPANDFTIISNAIIRDDRLTESELGLLVYLVHLPGTWKIQPTQLAERFKVNRDTVYKRLKSLRQLGYLEFDQSRQNGSFGGGTWKLAESPCLKKPDTVSPDTADPALLSTNKVLNTNSTKDTSTDWRQKFYERKPDCVTAEAWKDWIDYKIQQNKNRPISDRTVTMSANRLTALAKKGFDTSGVIEVTISRNWKGIGDDSYEPYQRFKRDLAAEILVL